MDATHGGLPDRKLHPHRIADVILVFDFGLGERGLLHDRPHHRLGAAIERAIGGELHQFARDLRLGVKVHRSVGMRPVADDAEAFEFLALHLDPVRGEGPALLAEFHQCRRIGQVRLRLAFGPIIFFLDLPLDRQPMAVPAGDVIGVEAEHLLAPRHHVLEDLVERMPDMDVAIGVRRTVVEDESRPALRRRAQPAVEIATVPALEDFRLFLRQAGAHREVGLGQKQRFAVIARVFRRLGHESPSNKPLAARKGLLLQHATDARRNQPLGFCVSSTGCAGGQIWATE